MTDVPGRRSEPRTPGSGSRRVIFVCTGNSARSQMAEALLRARGGGRFEVVSAGVDPKGVHPLTVRVLAELEVDIAHARSKSVSEFLDEPFDYVVTVCDRARESCPIFPGGGATLHWDVDDPALATGSEPERLAAFRAARDDIARRVQAFVAEVEDRPG